MTLFDAKTITGIQNVFEKIEWKKVEASMRVYHTKAMEIIDEIEDYELFTSQFSEILEQNFNILDNIYNTDS